VLKQLVTAALFLLASQPRAVAGPASIFDWPVELDQCLPDANVDIPPIWSIR